MSTNCNPRQFGLVCKCTQRLYAYVNKIYLFTIMLLYYYVCPVSSEFKFGSCKNGDATGRVRSCMSYVNLKWFITNDCLLFPYKVKHKSCYTEKFGKESSSVETNRITLAVIKKEYMWILGFFFYKLFDVFYINEQLVNIHQYFVYAPIVIWRQ